MRRQFPTLVVILAGLGPILLFGWLAGGLTAAEVGETRSISALEQFAQAAAGLGIKPLYSLLCLGLILFLWGQRARDISALRWGLVAFWTGETFCAINFWVFQHESLLSEYLHSYGMVLAFGLTIFAARTAAKTRLLKRNESTGRWRIGWVALVITAILCFIPLMAPVSPHTYAVSIYGFPYSYTRFALYEWYENRALPLLALTCCILAIIPLLRKNSFWSSALLSAALGALTFSLFRLVLDVIFHETLVWFEFWEEASELLYVLGVGLLLWRFKHLLEKTGPVHWLLDDKRKSHV